MDETAQTLLPFGFGDSFVIRDWVSWSGRWFNRSWSIPLALRIGLISRSMTCLIKDTVAIRWDRMGVRFEHGRVHVFVDDKKFALPDACDGSKPSRRSNKCQRGK